MPPSYQVDAVSVLLKQLDVQRRNLMSMLDRTNSVLNQFKVWSDGKENETSFLSMCHAIEDALKYVSTKCLEITREHNVEAGGFEEKFEQLREPTGVEILHKPHVRNEVIEISPKEEEQFISEQLKARIDVMEEAMSSITKTFFQHQADTDKAVKECTSKFMARVDEIESIFKKDSKKSNVTYNQLQTCKQNVKKLQENGLEYCSKIDCIVKETSSANVDISVMRQQINSLTKRVEENEGAIRSCEDLLSPLKNNVDNMSQLLHKSKQMLLEFQDEQHKNFDKMQQQISGVDEQCGTRCNLLYKKLAPLEKFQDSLKKESSALEEKQKKVDRLCFKVSKLEDQMNIMENQTVKKHSGFSTSLRKGYAAFTWFKGNSWQPAAQPTTDVRCNLGNHFNPTTGIYTAPIDNVYLIGLFICKDKSTSEKVSMVLDISKRTTANQLCVLQRLSVYENETKGSLIIIEELKKDEQLILGPYDYVKNVESSYFFCFGLN
ncbi:unnamed protein product [Lymnaea stagnalis]|uniref:C1q domain-containing protein n=1 Tax=Lymnaea stagnalis TaxID=6523 RepID=A0AAV2HYK5_LYMST